MYAANRTRHGRIVRRAAMVRTHWANERTIAWWPALAGLTGGGTWTDLTGRFPGTLTSFSGQPWTGPARPGGFGQLTFDGSASCVTTPAGLSAITLDDTTGFSISGWIRPTTIDGNWHSVIGKIANGNTNRQFWVAINGGFSCPTNGLSFFTGSAGNGAVGTNALTTNRWYFFVASHVGTSTGTLYVWSREGGWEAIVNGTTTGSTAVDVDAGTNPVTIGRFTAGNPLVFAGQIDDIRLRLGPTTQNQAIALLNLSRAGYPGVLARDDQATWAGLYSGGAAPATTLFRRTLYRRAGSRGVA